MVEDAGHSVADTGAITTTGGMEIVIQTTATRNETTDARKEVQTNRTYRQTMDI